MESKTSKAKYFEGVGRRKTAIARVRISKSHEVATVINEKPAKQFFQLKRLEKQAFAPLSELKLADKYSVNAKVAGGGINAQAEAIRHGLARALVKLDEGYKKELRVMGYLTRDSRMVERKKYGLKKARRAPQWAKR